MNNLPFLIFVAILVLLVAYLFQLWARHHRRLMIHRERLAALEKGVDLPPLVEQEIQRTSWNVQRLILLAGLCWISVGIALFGAVNELAGQTLQLPWGSEFSNGHPIMVELQMREGMRWLALAPVGIGISHLIVYFTGRRRDGA
jgi:hypothetical protein